MRNNLLLRSISIVLLILISTSVITGCDIIFGEGITTTTFPDAPATDPCGDHTDVDNNGFCDTCRYDVIETIDFYNFNDLHGKFLAGDTHPGVGKLTTYLERRMIIDEHVVILSTGDMWQGSGESNITKGAIITDWMNYLGFEAMTLGNHEYDWGSDHIKANAEIADFPFLAINIYDNATGERADYCDASVMIERGECKIGLIGAIGDCYTSIVGEMVEDVHFKVGGALTELVKNESIKLREAGADIIVYMIHDGGSYRNPDNYNAYYDDSLSYGGYVDLVFEGHSHSYYIFEDRFGVPHLQGGGDNSKGMTHVEVDVNFANGNIEYNEIGYVEHSDCASMKESPIIGELSEKYKEELDFINGNLGYNSTTRNSNEISNLVARLYYEAGVEKWGDEYDIVLAGGSINLRSPYNIYSGNVKYADVQTVLPFDNALYLCSIKGSALLQKFYNNSKYYCYSKLSASEIDPNATYYIIADKWTSGYDWAECTEIALYDDSIFARDLLAEYIRKGGWE